ncbi:hypothetical protein PRUPE_6G218900 [Prunus persica]|uniref:Uncharacterized protein n=2 Tax=Prunus TaxID=3754 RepID=M5W844_PRUPE|nr:uncharacterized protein LOC18775439 [Prunus persica]ONI02733.1 hypothetical protein PRUPE_6G218900 [Prunus persica]
MRREEKRRKFNEAVLNTLFPPPSPPSSPPVHSPKDEDVPLSILLQDFEEDLGESGSATTSGDDDGNGESEPQRLTRAQRKRLRKKKLKEDASRRRELIGPLLPPTVDQGENEAQGVRRNASEEPDAAIVEKPGDEPPACSNQNKVKQRRKAKKLAREREQD